MTDKNMKLNIA